MSIKTILVNKVKYSKLLYSCYYYFGALLISVLRLFAKPKDKLILFNSFGGRKFDDSPRAIYNAIIKDSRFDDIELVWAFHEPNKYTLPRGRKIKTDTLIYFWTSLKARVWITNSSIERGLSFKGKNTFYFNTWHGSPIKLMGNDILKENKSFKSKGENFVDIMTSQSDFDAEIFSRVFSIPKDNFRIIGLPRNDNLANYSDKQKQQLRKKLNLSQDKKVILYAPTYREYNQSNRGVEIRIPIDLHNWEKELKDDYILLFRAHYEVAKSFKITDNEFIRDVSKYPLLEDLMIASDILISDYSSIFFDYSIMSKPMLCFCYDYDEYEKERGMYFDIREYLPYAENEKDILSLLLSLDYNTAVQRTIKFRNQYVTAYGNATKQSLDIIAKELKL